MNNAKASTLDETIEHLVEIQRDHERSATTIQRGANWVTNGLGRPGTMAAITALIFAWIGGNFIAHRFGVSAFDEFPFPELDFVITIAALLIALLILTTQQHQDQLADRRAQLTLQIALLSEKKIAKVIALLEEQRRENPMLKSRVDAEASTMANSADPKESMRRLEQSVNR